MDVYLSIAAIIFAFASAWFWFLSSRIKFQFGHDMDAHLNETMVKVSKLNACAATFTALAVMSQAVSMLIVALKWV